MLAGTPLLQIFYEKNYLKLPGKIFQQWSYLWADNYTTAPYIAVVDDDVIFNLKVRPSDAGIMPCLDVRSRRASIAAAVCCGSEGLCVKRLSGAGVEWPGGCQL